MERIWRNILRSWITSIFGTVAGVPAILAWGDAQFDGDPATTASIWTLVTGIALVVLGLVARDGNKSSEEVGAKA